MDDFPKLSTGLSVRSLPSVFLVYQGKIVDTFVGIPEQKRLEEFFNTALFLNKMSTDDNVMVEIMKKIEEFILKDNIKDALSIL